MGLDAFVPCRCWEEGLTTAPPVDRADIYLTDWMPDMDLPHDGNEELWHRFDGWASNCCSHPDMEYAAAHVGNWSGIRRFQWRSEPSDGIASLYCAESSPTRTAARSNPPTPIERWRSSAH